MDKIVYNALRTPDGTVLESRHRHDYQTYTDANGCEYMVDGGLDYLRRSAQGDEFDLSVSLDHGHEAVREVLTWGTRGINGDQPLTYVKLCDMTSGHIQACLETQDSMYPQVRAAMQNELLWRGELPEQQTEKSLEDLLFPISEQFQKARDEYEADNDSWWHDLSKEEHEHAFYAVVKRIHQGDVVDSGSYRYVLYDVFGFDPSMYGAGMNCGYMDIHNLIGGGADLDSMRKINRLEIIDHTESGNGRDYVKHLSDKHTIEYSLQDDDHTLKIFISGKSGDTQ